MDKVNRFKDITEEMVELYTKKNSDYGDSVHDTYVKYGPVSFLVRMEDKINRVRTLTDTNYESRVRDEKVRDSLIDLANYAILMILEMESSYEFKVESFIAPREGLAYVSTDDNKWAFETERSDK